MNKRALYQPALRGLFLLFALVLLAACSPAAAPPQIEVAVLADGQHSTVRVAAGSRVSTALQAAGVALGSLDRSEPHSLAQLAEGDEVRVIRVEEAYEVAEQAIPFISRTLQNEAMGVGEQRMIQNGANGLEEVTYRLLYEDGELVSRTAVRSQVVTPPVEEIVMIGAQSPFSALTILGRLTFLAGGNAWLLESNTGSRQAVVTTGDLDGRIFEISPDGEWLLYTRASEDAEQINALWVASLDDYRQIDLGVGNVVHYAGWVLPPSAIGGSTQIAFSTVEPSPNPPGWAANNDLQFINFTPSGDVTAARQGLPTRSTDSLYSWWGSAFAWSADGETLAFTRPDGVGVADVDTDRLQTLLSLTPYQTNSDWAWMPSLAWGADGWLYTVDHAPQSGLEVQERSPLFDLVALSPQGELRRLLQNVGMFANPVPEPGGGQVAFLRSFTPTQSEISSYELMVLAPDSGVTMTLFPPQGAAGLQPQRVAWAPAADAGPMLAFVYQGNLWVANVLTGEARQLTGDGLVGAVSWK
ncbi:MAG: G5 domain-containing protein [Anaerolineales bacterium]|nr:G5 domain-containing protein [Anaerolineales bacterium]